MDMQPAEELLMGREGGNPACAPVPCASLPCSSTCVMVQRRPDSALATITITNPARLNSVSPATSSPRPRLMTSTTSARLQLGLHAPFYLALVLSSSIPLGHRRQAPAEPPARNTWFLMLHVFLEMTTGARRQLGLHMQHVYSLCTPHIRRLCLHGAACTARDEPCHLRMEPVVPAAEHLGSRWVFGVQVRQQARGTMSRARGA